MGCPSALIRRWLSSLLLAAAASWAQAADGPWSSTEAQPSAAWTAHPGASGWNCNEFVALPAPGHVLAVCRHDPPTGSGKLTLLLLTGDAATRKVREVARLADATHAHLRLFTPTRPCVARAPSACLTAVVLVDQNDESSCYGTQVLATTSSAPLRSVGFIDEVRNEGGGEKCVGSLATLSGGAAIARIDLPGPLARIGRDGVTGPVRPESVSYRIAAARPSLRRIERGR